MCILASIQLCEDSTYICICIYMYIRLSVCMCGTELTYDMQKLAVMTGARQSVWGRRSLCPCTVLRCLSEEQRRESGERANRLPGTCFIHTLVQ